MLKLKDIELSFPNKKHVLNDITLTLDQKEVVGLVAPNGTGKTTLFLDCIIKVTNQKM